MVERIGNHFRRLGNGPESDRESDLREVPLVHVVILCGVEHVAARL